MSYNFMMHKTSGNVQLFQKTKNKFNTSVIKNKLDKLKVRFGL